MTRWGHVTLIAAALCFAAFFGNVAMGAARLAVPLGDIAEMLMLLLASVLFVVGVLALEAGAGGPQDDPAND